MTALGVEIELPGRQTHAARPADIADFVLRIAQARGCEDVEIDLAPAPGAALTAADVAFTRALRADLEATLGVELFMRLEARTLSREAGLAAAELDAYSKIVWPTGDVGAANTDWEPQVSAFLAAVVERSGRPPAAQIAADGGPGAAVLFQTLAGRFGFRGIEVVPAGEAAEPTALSELFRSWIGADDPNVTCYPVYAVLHQMKIGEVMAAPRITPADAPLHVDRRGRATYLALRRAGVDDGVDVAAGAPETLSSARLVDWLRQIAEPPPACAACCWWSVCRGGAPEHRWSDVAGFRNPSRHCAALDDLYTTMAQTLLAAGLPYALLLQNLRAPDAVLAAGPGCA